MNASRQELTVSSPQTVNQASDLVSSTVNDSKFAQTSIMKTKGDKQEHAMQPASTPTQSVGTGWGDSCPSVTSSITFNSDADNVASPSLQAVPSRKRPLDTPDFAPSKSRRMTLAQSTASSLTGAESPDFEFDVGPAMQQTYGTGLETETEEDQQQQVEVGPSVTC